MTFEEACEVPDLMEAFDILLADNLCHVCVYMQMIAPL